MRQPIKLIQPLLVSFLIIVSSFYMTVSGQVAGNKQDTVPTQNSPKQPVYTTTRLSTAKPVIDGKLDDECWKTGTWAGDYHQFVPNEGAKPTLSNRIENIV